MTIKIQDTMDPLQTLPFIKHTDSGQFFLIAGPCVIEDEKTVMHTASHIATLTEKYRIPFVFKSSYRKANRSRLDSFTGIGDSEALAILRKVRKEVQIPVVTDIHAVAEAEMAAESVDMLQIPAFLCRQTDLLVAAAKTGKVINIKKGQFLSPASMKFAVDKVRMSGNDKIILTDRGTMFGYNDLIVDVRSIPEMKKLGTPTVVDITHSLQQPNQPGGVSGGRPEMIETIGRAAVAAGADGIFLETHPDPAVARSDGANMLPLDKLEKLLAHLASIRDTINRF